jgi:hypothetical protein
VLWFQTQCYTDHQFHDNNNNNPPEDDSLYPMVSRTLDNDGSKQTYTQPLAPTDGNTKTSGRGGPPQRRNSTQLFEEAKNIIEEIEKVMGGKTNNNNNSSTTTNTNNKNNNSLASFSSATNSPSLLISTNEEIVGNDDIETVTDRNMPDYYGDYGDYSGMVLKSSGVPHRQGTMYYKDYDRKYKGEWYV